MEQSPQNPGAPAQDSTMQASTVQGTLAGEYCAEQRCRKHRGRSYCGTYRNRPPEPRARPRRRWCRLRSFCRGGSTRARRA